MNPEKKEDIIEKVKQCASELWGAAEGAGARMLLVHYLTGTNKQPYGGHRSSYLKLIPVAALYKNATNYPPKRPDEEELDQRIIKDTISLLSRENTYLHAILRIYAHINNRLIRKKEHSFRFSCHSKLVTSTADPAAQRARPHDGLCPLSIRIRIPEEDSKTVSNKKISIDWSVEQGFLSTLVPPDIWIPFFLSLYERREDVKEIIKICLERSREEAINYCIRSPHKVGLSLGVHTPPAPVKLKSIADYMEQAYTNRSIVDYRRQASTNRLIKDMKTYRTIFNQITCLQAMSLYLYWTKGSKQVSCTTTVVPLDPVDPDKAEYPVRLGVIITSPELNREIDKDVLEYAIGTLRNIPGPKQKTRLPTDIAVKIRKMSALGESCGAIIDNAVDTLFQSATESGYSKLFGSWIAYLMKELSGRTHEGGYVEFYFVLGEKSQFEDDHNINFRHFTQEGEQKSAGQKENSLRTRPHYKLLLPVDELLGPKSDRKDRSFNRKSKQVADILADEHFPWFENGRNALFFNVSGTHLLPDGLVTIKNSHWSDLFDDRVKGESLIRIPSCILGCVPGKTETASILTLLNTNNSGGRMRVEEICRWQNKQWFEIRERKRMQEIIKRIRKNIIWRTDIEYPGTDRRTNRAPPRSLKEILESVMVLVMQIAKDPGKGGTILFVEEDAIADFKPMGIPLEIDGELTNDDRIGLIAHDGASPIEINFRNCFNGKEDEEGRVDFRWAHRRLLTLEGVKLRDLKALFDSIDSSKKESPLLSVGSRRWSAAISAFHPKVQGVLVISQDGDIQFWCAKRIAERSEKQLTGYEVKVIKFTTTGDAQEYWLDEGKWKVSSRS